MLGLVPRDLWSFYPPVFAWVHPLQSRALHAHPPLRPRQWCDFTPCKRKAASPCHPSSVTHVHLQVGLRYPWKGNVRAWGAGGVRLWRGPRACRSCLRAAVGLWVWPCARCAGGSPWVCCSVGLQGLL